MPLPKLPRPAGQTGRPANGKLDALGLVVLRVPALRFHARRFHAWHSHARHSLGAALAVALGGFILLVVLLLPVAPVHATSAAGLPSEPPTNHVLDGADLLSRAAVADVARGLEQFSPQQVQASWVSVDRLDYGLGLPQLGEQLLERWSGGTDQNQLLFLIDGQTSATAIVASAPLQQQLGADLLKSTARTTMAQPLREGARYRQASLDAMNRIAVVLAGGADPGPPEINAVTVLPTHIPSREETESSNAFTWVIVLLVVGTLVPMLTWWVFSR